jgi:uncharacterized protein HemX
MDSKTPVPPPDVVNWVINQASSILAWFIGGIIVVLGFLGRNFWQSQVIKPQEELKADMASLKAEQNRQTEEAAQMKQTLAVLIEQNKNAAHHRAESDQKLDMILEILIKDKKR